MKPAQAARAASLIFACVACAKLLVTFFEGFSVANSERSADLDLIKLCDSGQATSSPRFRNACVQARAQIASPLVLKALLRAFKLAYTEFAESVSSWHSLLTGVLFLLSGLAFPLARLAAAALAERPREEEEAEAPRHVALLVSAADAPRQRPWLRLRKPHRRQRDEERASLAELEDY